MDLDADDRGHVSTMAEHVSSTVLPEQHEDQIDLGYRMVKNAFNNKVHSLDHELHALRLTKDEHTTQASQLQRKNSQLESDLVESHHRSQQLVEENKELFKTVQQLRRQLGRLEGLKKKVMESLSEEHHNASSHEETDHRLYMRDDYLIGSLPLTVAATQGKDVTRPRPVSQPASPRPAVGSTPRMVGESRSYEEQPGPEAGGTLVDGKQFFRQARSNLSYEAFNEFLASIKKLNSQQQTREQTLEEARGIFGPELSYLYKEFEQLLQKHSPGY